MSGKSAIGWTDLTWNPLAGCTRVSRGCDRCYAFTLHDMRHKLSVENNGVYPKSGRAIPKQYALPFDTIQILPERIEDPLHIKKPQKIFVNSMSDLFHSQVPEKVIQQIFQTMIKAHWHSFQILTKRPARLARLAPTLPWPSNIFIGTSVELDQLTPRIDLLRKVQTSNRFLSLEPLLGPLPSLNLDGICWAIVGGESGEGARPMQIDWARDIRDKCQATDTPLFLKQMGSVWAQQHHPANRHGDKVSRWPLDLQIQEFPAGMVVSRMEVAHA
jgi:protein gp37